MHFMIDAQSPEGCTRNREVSASDLLQGRIGGAKYPFNYAAVLMAPLHVQEEVRSRFDGVGQRKEMIGT